MSYNLQLSMDAGAATSQRAASFAQRQNEKHLTALAHCCSPLCQRRVKVSALNEEEVFTLRLAQQLSSVDVNVSSCAQVIVSHSSPVLQAAESAISRQHCSSLRCDAASDCDVVTVCGKQTPLLLQLIPELTAWQKGHDEDEAQPGLRGNG